MTKITHNFQIVILSVSLLTTSIVIFLLASANHLAFAQIPGVVNTPSSGSDQQEQSQPTPSSLAESTNFTNYKDPQGRFSIDYPSGWQVQSATNRFETRLAAFQAVSSVKNLTDVNIALARNTGIAVKTLGLEQVLRSIINYRQIIEPVECSKYTLDGNQACSVIGLGPIVAKLQIISAIGDHVYIFTYDTFPDNFDKNLPIAEHMINSFKFGPEAAR